MSPSQGYVSVSRRPPDIEDYIDIVRRYRSWIIGPLFAGLVVSVVVAYMWPDTYISSAVMRITPQQIPDRLVPSNLNTQMAERLQQMQQEILSRSSLIELVQRASLDLYKKERASKPMEDIVETMRKDIKLSIMETPTSMGRRAASAFQVSFSYSDRYKAQSVVRELVTKFTEQNVNVARSQNAQTTNFLTDELNQAKKHLDDLDKEIMKFRTENAGRLPEQLDSNLSTLNALESRLAAVTETLNRNSQEKMQLETQLQNTRGQVNFFTSMSNNEGSAGPAQTVKNERLVQMNKAILDTETQLAALREIYKDDYPEIRKFKAQLDALYRQRADLEKEDDKQQQERARQQQQDAGKAAEAQHRMVRPEVAKALEDLKGQMASLETAIRNKEMDIKERIMEQAALHSKIQAYQGRIDVSPINQQKYQALMREYTLAKEKYDEFNKKKGDSETASAMEDRKAGENLEVLDPASLPESPSEPNRLVIAAVGTGIGFLVGVFLAGAKEMKDSSLKNLKDVRTYTNLAVLSSIPLLENALLVRRKRRLFWLAWTSAVIIGTIAMSGSMYFYYFGKS
jgi:polysaccharide biosynthesis transport protein